MSTQQYCLVSDLDGTMLGDDDALRAFAGWLGERRDEIRLVYATGRLYPPVAELVRTTSLPEPEVVIGGVGSEMRRFPSGESVREWETHIARDWDGDKVRRLLSSLSFVEMQPDEFQTDYKVSCYLYDTTGGELASIEQLLRSQPLKFQMIYSSNRDLDILPINANKGKAAAFLTSMWDIPRERVMVAGDTGNDMALFDQGFKGIVVGNAHQELKNLDADHIYHAEQPFAGGVAEGLNHWLSSPAR